MWSGGGGGVWGKECEIHYRGDNSDQGEPVGIEERGKGGIECRMKQNRVNLDSGAPTGNEERRKGESSVEWNGRSSIPVNECWQEIRSTYRRGGGPQGDIKRPTHVWLMSEVASGVRFITRDGQNVTWYSSWENITVAFIPLAYSESVQWIAAGASTKVCGVRGWISWGVVGWCPKLLAVIENWC